MKNIKVSVIIPVYNTEKYIKECLESVLNQEYKNLEIIVINDGTQDNSMQIVGEYLKDQRIKIINKENGGLSSARNEGIKVATGEYISFIDSDDWIDKNLYENIVNEIKEEDILIFNSRTIDDETRKIKQEKIINTEYLSSIKKGYLLYYISDYSSCNKIYKLDFLKRNNIKFLEGVIHEDRLWCLEVLYKTDNIKVSNIIGYNYRVNRKGSIIYESNNVKDLLKKSYEKESLLKIMEKMEEITKIKYLSIEEVLKIKFEIERIRNIKDGYINYLNIKKDLEIYFKSNKVRQNFEILRKELRELLETRRVKKIKNIKFLEYTLLINKVYNYKVFRRVFLKKIKNNLFKM